MKHMKRAMMLMLFAVAGFCVVQAVPRAQKAASDDQTKPPLTLSVRLLQEYRGSLRNVSEAAAKMPEADYGFRPTPAIKPFGQLVAHVALIQFLGCSQLKGEPNPRKDEKEEAARTKSEVIALLDASTRYCAPLLDGMTDPMLTELVKVENLQAAKGVLPAALVAHNAEMYGVMTVYLRLKGIVPPSTERAGRDMETRK